SSRTNCWAVPDASVPCPIGAAHLFSRRPDSLTPPFFSRHNDLPWQLLKRFNNRLSVAPANLTLLNDTHTNIPKLQSGHVGGQFWAAYVPCDTQNKDAVKRTLEQIDVIHRMCDTYPETFTCVTNSAGIEEAFKAKKIASLIGVEGGHSIDSSLGVLRMFYRLGRVVQEMNRLGMIVDLAHVSVKTMTDALEISKAPVIFSHSSAYELCRSRRNVPDDILRRVNQTGSLVMVNFYNAYVSCNKQAANLSQVADHLDHVKKVAGYEAVGFGGDYDGVTTVPQGLEDVSKYPDLIAELLRRNWTAEEVKAALATNLLRVFRKVEKVSDLIQEPADDEPIEFQQLDGQCRTSYGYPASTSSSAPSVLPSLSARPQLVPAPSSTSEPATAAGVGRVVAHRTPTAETGVTNGLMAMLSLPGMGHDERLLP
uniref:Dipeptidase n=1 Tax=Pelusios castaneus TaxID=367368 RepID=A0A8C8VKD6_9SAUR